MRPYFKKKNPSQKRTGGVAQGVGPEFKPQYHNIYICIFFVVVVVVVVG
jgi:hypothetical protein